MDEFIAFGLPPKLKPKKFNAKQERSSPSETQSGGTVEAKNVPIRKEGETENTRIVPEPKDYRLSDYPYVDWHLQDMLSANYVDPFTLPIAHMQEQEDLMAYIVLMDAIAQKKKEQSANDSDDKPAENK